MTDEPQVVSAVRETDTIRGRIGDWILLEGDRRLVASGLVALVVGGAWTLIDGGVLAVGPDSSVASVFASGLTAGVITLLTIALSINQLVLSRVFGSVNVLTDRLDGSRALRQRVESLAGVSASPNDPADFLSLTARTLSDRADGLVAAGDGTDWDPPPKLERALSDLCAYGESLDARLESTAQINTVLGVVLGTEYAENMTAVRYLRNEYAASMPEAIGAEFQALEELLESIAIVRQFYKTIAVQQDLATLSRLLVYSGLTALSATLFVALVYRTNAVTLPVRTLPVVVSVGIGIVLTPLALFVAYVLRAATIARRTVSVGPFIPPYTRG